MIESKKQIAFVPKKRNGHWVKTQIFFIFLTFGRETTNCRGTLVENVKKSQWMAWMPAYKTVPNLLSMISMVKDY
jgi:hypothetical protein